MNDVLVGKVTISASLKKIHFPKISEQAPLSTVCYVFPVFYIRLNHVPKLPGKEISKFCTCSPLCIMPKV